MAPSRKIPFLSFVVSPYRKVKINLSGCNFNCKGCFAIAKEEVGRDLSVKQLINLITKSCSFLYGEMVDDVQMTGGEPTMDRDYLVSLICSLRELGAKRVGISTNGYLLNRNFVKELKSLDVSYIKLDIKAYTGKIHRWYTGRDNANVLKAVNLLHEYDLNFYVRTIVIPNLVDVIEVKKIGEFLGRVSKRIHYKLYQFATEYAHNETLRNSPKHKDMMKAFKAAKGYLGNVEFYVTETAYKPITEFIEVRDDELLEKFKKIDEISKSVIKTWNMKYFTMNQILNS